MSYILDKVKILHASNLRNWTRFPEYRDYTGPTLAEYRTKQRAAEDVLWELREPIKAQHKLAELDVARPAEYARHEIPVPSSLLDGWIEIPLPEPEHAVSTITCDVGDVVGDVLRIRRTWRAQTVTARYSCPSHVLHADEISALKEMLAEADDAELAKIAEAQSSRYRQPLLFISHRWERSHHPDPEGHQLTKLQALEDCFLIYDYSSFPQDTTAPDDEAALREILHGMSSLISNIVVLAAPDFLERGWCIYEYTVASMRASIVCDELNDPDFVLLRNLAATRPPASLRISGGGMESEIHNAKNQKTLETVNKIRSLFQRSKFSVERDRRIVLDLLVAELADVLPNKLEYMPYVGEWKSIPWTEADLREAFASELTWPKLQYSHAFKPFEQKVPSSVAAAVANGYHIDEMPAQNDWTWATLLDTQSLGKPWEGLGEALLAYFLAAAAIIVLAVVLLIVLIGKLFF